MKIAPVHVPTNSHTKDPMLMVEDGIFTAYAENALERGNAMALFKNNDLIADKVVSVAAPDGSGSDAADTGIAFPASFVISTFPDIETVAFGSS
jgi:hypothetical protein